ncbi:MAG: hypothetical protein U5K81_14010 [Trueperaceae bacterium]|nr:hypothetical protein [Trueperaceae bacterium]
MQPSIWPHTEASGSEHDAFALQYLEASKRNPQLEGYALHHEADLQRALAELNFDLDVQGALWIVNYKGVLDGRAGVRGLSN